MMTSKACLFGNDLALSAIFATDDPERKTPRPSIASISSRGAALQNSYKNYEMRLALGRTGQRRLAEGNIHDKLCSTDLSACDQRASSPDT